MKKILLFVFILSLPLSTYASDIYTAQLASGLMDGSSCDNAKALSTINWGPGNDVAAGDTLHVCGTITQNLTVNASGTDLSSNAVIIYFEENAMFESPYWGAGSSAAIYLPSTTQYVIVDGGTNGLIQATDNGVGLAYQNHGYGVDIASDNAIVKNMNITNIFQRDFGSDEDNYGICIRAANANNIYIHDNTISEANTGIKAQGASGGNYNIYNNTVAEVSNGIMVGTTSGAIDIVKIYNNIINLGDSWGGKFDSGEAHHADGVQVYSNDSGITNLEIFGNTFGPDWPMKVEGVESASTSPIFTEDYTSGMIYNNLIFLNGDSWLTNPALNAGGQTGWGNDVLNNTVISTMNRNTCLGIRGDCIAKNNICIDVGYGAKVTSLNDPSQIDNNIYTGISEGFYDGTYIYNLSSWQSSGYDVNSTTAPPESFSTSDDYRLNSTDVQAITQGVDLSTHFNTDKDGNIRPTNAWDIGAYQYSSGDQPFAPSNFRVEEF